MCARRRGRADKHDVFVMGDAGDVIAEQTGQLIPGGAGGSSGAGVPLIDLDQAKLLDVSTVA